MNGMHEIKTKIQEVVVGDIMFDEPMSAHTSLRIGGPVDMMVFPEDPVSLRNVLVAAYEGDIPVFFFGAGTNLLAADSKIKGIAVSLKKFNSIEPTRETDETGAVIYAGSGVLMAQLISVARKSGYSGLEPLAGIPGYVGGAVYMNAGSYGMEMKDLIVSVAIMNMKGVISILEREEIDFSYRSSNLPGDSVILSANIKLTRDDPDEVEKRVKDYLKQKRDSQPIGELSAGCVFKNPEGTSAGLLIDRAGCKGMKQGGIEVSSVHANFFINSNSGTCGDFVRLMETVKAKVNKDSGIELEPEVMVIGKND